MDGVKMSIYNCMFFSCVMLKINEGKKFINIKIILHWQLVMNTKRKECISEIFSSRVDLNKVIILGYLHKAPN